jgi:hypothetical protein
MDHFSVNSSLRLSLGLNQSSTGHQNSLVSQWDNIFKSKKINLQLVCIGLFYILEIDMYKIGVFSLAHTRDTAIYVECWSYGNLLALIEDPFLENMECLLL